MPTRDRIPCPVCRRNTMQRTSRRCAECAYVAKNIASDVKQKQFVKRLLVDRTLVIVMEPWQVTDFVEVMTGEVT